MTSRPNEQTIQTPLTYAERVARFSSSQFRAREHIHVDSVRDDLEFVPGRSAYPKITIVFALGR